MTIAIPTHEGQLHMHFGGTKEFTFIDVDEEHRLVLSNRPVAAPPHQPGLFPRWLREHGTTVVIAGGIGRRALQLFAQQGIDVRAGTEGWRVEELVAAFLEGKITSAPEGCMHHEDHQQGGAVEPAH